MNQIAKELAKIGSQRTEEGKLQYTRISPRRLIHAFEF